MTTFEQLLNDQLSEEQMCKLLGCALSTLRCQRCRGTDHPPYVKIGNKIYYPAAEYVKWREKRIKRPLKAS